MAGLFEKVRDQGGIYKRYANFLEKLGIVEFKDFLFHIPFRYDDFSIISTIDKLQEGETVTIRGEVLEIKNDYLRGHLTIQRAKIKDDTGIIETSWFNQPYIAKSISSGDKISLSGKVVRKMNKLTIPSPEFEIGEGNFLHTGRLVPVYPETRGVSSKWLRRQVYKILTEQELELEEFLPEKIINNNKLESITSAIKNVHFPSDLSEIERAKERLSFDELFLIQLSANVRKEEWRKKQKGFQFEINKFEKELNNFYKNLPFDLTGAQKRTIDEIFKDFEKGEPMNRLLEGDVGSGKTVVAAIGIYISFLNGFQSVLMAPTEILALQHYKTINNLLSPLKIKVGIATSSKKENTSDFDVLVGTHALISKNIKFNNLGFVVIDEQQRFGVEQRSILREKGKSPHLLTMTATPIPRTIALTLYGDLDLSILDEMPKGRKIIKTWLVPSKKREDAYEWIKKEIKNNKSQVFIVCPFIEESESMTSVKAAAKEYEFLKKDIFKKYKLELLHGKIKPKEKEIILNDFKNQKFDILVATPVVEVGIDIPNADIIIIEAAERFGLSQLHQLRGRVGRNDRQAYCLLFTEAKSPQSIERLRAMEKTNIGAELAELDFKQRGPGEIYGTSQHGRNTLRVANFSDFELISKTKKEAEKIIKDLDKYPKLLKKIEEVNIKHVSPD